ncbi:hypothetical protein [Leptospira interrogans]|uniref:hypothetical protein n=1 Tax=Leptospira interrogans TaxID=173 RepID=UPI0007735443|nr:hypothetical protein [Leptospira interrogans]
MSWTQVDVNKYESSSGWTLELDGGYGWIMYHEDIEDELPDTFFVLADLFGNPGQAVVTVDPLTGKIPTTLIPSLAINDIFTVNSQVAQLALIAQRGDVAIRSDLPGPPMFILAGDDPTYLANWIPITTTYPDWNNIQNKPSFFPPSGHGHDSDYYRKSEVDSFLADKRNTSTLIPATDVTTDSTHRFVTDAEKTTWSASGSGLSNPLNQDINFSIGRVLRLNNVPIAGWLDNGTPFFKKRIVCRFNNGVNYVNVSHNVANARANARIIGFKYIAQQLSPPGSNIILIDNYTGSNTQIGSISYDDTSLYIVRGATTGAFDFIMQIEYI